MRPRGTTPRSIFVIATLMLAFGSFVAGCSVDQTPAEQTPIEPTTASSNEILPTPTPEPPQRPTTLTEYFAVQLYREGLSELTREIFTRATTVGYISGQDYSLSKSEFKSCLASIGIEENYVHTVDGIFVIAYNDLLAPTPDYFEELGEEIVKCELRGPRYVQLAYILQQLDPDYSSDMKKVLNECLRRQGLDEEYDPIIEYRTDQNWNQTTEDKRSIHFCTFFKSVLSNRVFYTGSMPYYDYGFELESPSPGS